MSSNSQLGLIGLAVMGANFARNFANKGIKIAVYNRTFSKTQEFLLNKHENITGFESLADFIQNIERPRKIILLVKSGEPVDDFIQMLKPHLEEGDIILDCGNSNWKDTKRRQIELVSNGLHFIGCGISGGEEGALNGPSIMPGGKKEAVDSLLSLLEKVAAKDFNGQACVANIGLSGSGHFVKTVHNGIEYAIMQGIAEIYDILRNVYKTEDGGYDNDKLKDIFSKVNSRLIQSFLLDITVDILGTHDNLNSGYLVDKIKDKAGAKGTGRWTVESALELGVAVPTISASLFARVLSARTFNFKVSKNDSHNLTTSLNLSEEEMVELVYKTLETVYLCAYIQGMDLIFQANKDFDWQINISEVARIWQGGCIIRSKMLEKLPEYITGIINLDSRLENLKNIANIASTPKPVINSCTDYIASLLAEELPANLIQAQRDFFGAHTYERTDQPGIFTGGWVS